ncbi:MAG: hypothetical protein LBF40_04650 [Deltaproteobacteria bacterium]|jgi:hypothetical protein|nr:hypothetical protein [Deltaproteobacteria bacterium]
MQLLSTSDIGNLAPEIIEEVRAQRTRPHIDKALEACLGPGGPSFLAVCEDKTGTGVLEWYTGLPGTTIPRSDLGSEFRFRLDGMLSEAAASIGAEADSLSLSAVREERVTAAFLHEIAESVEALVSGGKSPVSAFLVGDRPVIAGWGLMAAPALAAAPPPAWQPAPMPQIPVVADATAFPPAGPPGPAGNAKGPGPRKPLRLVLAAFGILLALSILLAVFFPDLRDYLPIWVNRHDSTELNRPKPGRVPAQRREPVPKPSPRDPGPDTVPGPGKPQPRLKPGEGLVIPKGGDPNDLSFLKGCWKSEAGVVNTKTKMPVIFVYCLDDKGTGTVSLEEYDKSGKRIGTCKTGLAVSREGDTVLLNDDGVKCQDGRGYEPNSLSCESGPGKISQCVGKNSKVPPFQVKFTYVGDN